ncbi:MAG: Yip1 family protein [Pseudobdellovibrionaceae bacterium]
MNSSLFQHLRSQAVPILQYLKAYIKNPVAEIARTPNWDWRTLIFVQIFLGVISGTLAGVVSLSFAQIFIGFFLAPFSYLIATSIMSLVIYYFFLLLLNRQLNALKLMTVVVLANLPFYVLQIVTGLIPYNFLTLAGLGFSAFLLIVGLVENFSIPKKMAIRVVAGLFFLILLLFAFNNFEAWRERNKYRVTPITPESQSTLEKEFE